MAKRSRGKAARLLQIEALLLAHPEGLIQAEIARKLDVDRSTVGRYVPDLPGHIYIDDLDGNRWKIDRDAYLVKVRFNLHEALSLHLAARLMATRTDKHNPHAAAALRKIGISLERLAPLISDHVKSSADVMDDAARRHDPVYLESLETLTRAWSLGRKAQLKHQLPDGRVFEYAFAPYFVEPYAVGQTAHVIGWREPPGAVRTFKIERIRAIKLLEEGYAIPEEFDARALLADAWGIWYTEDEPVDVVLRFHPRVAHRVRESRWHPREELLAQEDGSLIWTAPIAEPREMLPWIRGWGADVEVLAPEGLRERMAAEARRLARQYGWEVHRDSGTDEQDEHRFFDDFFGG
jgi:CRISPR-associated endonuclease/helicase Cas3